MSDQSERPALRGRRDECEILNALTLRAQTVRSAVLVLRGEAGVGKSALLEHVAQNAAGFRVAFVTGVEAEMELAFAGLHQLCAPMLDHLDRLPAPQRDALSTALGLSAAAAPDRFLVGLAVLSLLAEVADQRPLVCLIDDAQWLDQASAQTLQFVTRRLHIEPIAMVFAVREPDNAAVLSGLPELLVRGLPDGEARALLDSVVPGRLDERVRDRIVAETRGNPLALLELPQTLTTAELAGGFGRPDTRPLASRIEQNFERRIQSLPMPTQRLLLAAAAEPLGDVLLLWRAAALLGLAAEDAQPAEAAGLIEIDTRVRFRHPLVRSAAYRSATTAARHDVHRALGEATEPETDPDRRSWHYAHAAAGPNEQVAADLEGSADRAQARGGVAAAAAFLERAATLSPDSAHRASRSLDAAQAKFHAGAPAAALRLLAAAEGGPLGELERARVDLLRAEIAYSQNRGSHAPPLLLQAARRLEPLDAGLARRTYLDALWAAHFAGRLAIGGGLREVAQAALAGPEAAEPPTASDLLLDGLATAAISGYAVAVPKLRLAVSAFRSPEISTEDELRWLWHAGVAAMDLWDDESFDVLTARQVELGRQSGVLEVMPIALSARILAQTFAGRIRAASQLIQELQTIADAIGSEPPPYGPMFVAAWRGREPEAARLIDAALVEVGSRGEGAGLAVAHYSRAVLYNGLGRYEEALEAATASDVPEEESFTVTNMSLVELIEAATRTGSMHAATDALDRLSEMTRAADTDWALGLRARSEALLSSGGAAEALFLEGIERLGRTRIRVHLARTHLVYGEWLRRENRRVDARKQLDIADEMLTHIGAEAFAARAQRELLATGAAVRKHTAPTRDDLTAQEAQIARLAGDGLTNTQIGTHLFLSPHTVEWHLRKVFGKLGISSRKQLLGTALVPS